MMSHAAARPGARAADQRAGLRRAGPAAVPGPAPDGAVLGGGHRRHLRDDRGLVPVDRPRRAARARASPTWIVAQPRALSALRRHARRRGWCTPRSPLAVRASAIARAARQRRPAPAAGLARGPGGRAARDRPPAGPARARRSSSWCAAPAPTTCCSARRRSRRASTRASRAASWPATARCPTGCRRSRARPADAALTRRVEDGVIAGVDQVLGETQQRAALRRRAADARPAGSPRPRPRPRARCGSAPCRGATTAPRSRAW